MAERRERTLSTDGGRVGRRDPARQITFRRTGPGRIFVYTGVCHDFQLRHQGHHARQYLIDATGIGNAQWQDPVRVCDIVCTRARPRPGQGLQPYSAQEYWQRDVPEVRSFAARTEARRLARARRLSRLEAS